LPVATACDSERCWLFVSPVPLELKAGVSNLFSWAAWRLSDVEEKKDRMETIFLGNPVSVLGAFDGEDNSGVLKRLADGRDVVGTRFPNAVLKIADRHFAKIGLCGKSHSRPVQ
jgi:hypothetical protein